MDYFHNLDEYRYFLHSSIDIKQPLSFQYKNLGSFHFENIGGKQKGETEMLEAHDNQYK